MVPVRLLLYVCDLCHQWSVRPPAPPSHFGNMIPTTHCLLSASSTQVQNLQGNCQTPQPAPLFRAGLRSRNAHGHVIRAILCGNLPGNCQTAPAGPLFHAGLRDRKCTWTCHKSHFMQKFKGKLPRRPSQRPCFVRACAIEMHMDMSQEPFYAEIYRETCEPPRIPPRMNTGP